MRFKILLFSLLVITQSTLCQNNGNIKLCLNKIDEAYQSYNWEQVTANGHNLVQFIRKSKFELGDSILLINTLQAYYRISVAYTWLQKPDSAQMILDKFDLIKSIFPYQFRYSEYYKQCSRGNILFINNHLEEAEKLFQANYNYAVAKFPLNKTIYFDAVKNLALYYIESKAYNKAAALLWETMIEIESFEKDNKLLAEIYYYQFLVYFSKAEYSIALDYSQKSLEALKTRDESPNKYMLSRALQAVGISLYKLHEYYAAKEFLHKSLDIQLDFNNEKNPELALCYNYLAKVYYELDNKELAIEYMRKPSEIYQKIYSKKTHFKVLQLETISMIYMFGLNNEKFESFDPELYQMVNDLDYVFTNLSESYAEENYPMWVYQYSTQAFTYLRMKDYENANLYLKKVLNLQEKIIGAYPRKLTPLYQLIGNNFYLNNQFDSANFYYQKAIDTQSKNLIGLNDKNEQLELSNYAITPALLSLFSSKAKCYIRKASNEEKEGMVINNKLALDNFLISDTIAEELRQKMNRKEDKMMLSKQMTGIYNSAINICFELSNLIDNKELNNKYLSSAFYFSQKNKTRLLEEIIANSGAEKFVDIPDSLLNKETDFQNKIAFWERRISASFVKDSGDYDHSLIFYRKRLNKKSFNQTSFNDSLFKYSKQYEQLIDYYNNQYPKYYELKYSNKVHTISEIQNNLDINSAVLDYHIGENTIDIFVITKGGFHAQQIITRESMDSLITAYRQSISAYQLREDFLIHAYDDFIENSKKIYKYLIKPVEENIKDKNKLIIIISEALSMLPFETLVSDNAGVADFDLASLSYLIKKHDVVYNYSANLWLNSINKSLEYSNIKTNLLAMAPVFDPEKMQTSIGFPDKNIEYASQMVAKNPRNLMPLMATKQAIEEISQIAQYNQIVTKKVLYENATKNSFKLLAPFKKIILIATHGRSDDENPNFAGLYFATDKASNQEYGNAFLYSNETYNLNLSCDLLVLYACETGVGIVKKGEGVMTISRGFMASGAANIVQSLWSIQDASSKDLIVNMFKSVFNQTSYSKSLQQAKLEMIGYGIIPFHWSGLVLLGH